VTHSWIQSGDFNVRVQAMDETGRVSDWSVPLVVSVSELPPALITGSTGNGSVVISTRYLDSQHAQTFKAPVTSIQSVSLALAKVGTLDPDFRILVSIRSSQTTQDLGYGYVRPQDVASTILLRPVDKSHIQQNDFTDQRKNLLLSFVHMMRL
jgi:hypothetical protein